jgi:hypothetical protein
MMFLILAGLCFTSGCTFFTKHESHNGTVKELGEIKFIIPGDLKPANTLYSEDGNTATLQAERRCIGHMTGYGCFEAKYYWRVKDVKDKPSMFDERFYPYDISKRCRPYIEKNDSGKMSFEQFQKLTNSEPLDLGQLRAAFGTDFLEARPIKKKYQIICLKPLVAVVLDVDNIAWNRIFSYRYGSKARADGKVYYVNEAIVAREKGHKFDTYDTANGFQFPAHSIGDSLRELHLENGLVLPNGLDYGLEMPYAKNPRWFSPDLEVKNKPVEMISKTKGRIKVPWGYLYLTKSNNKWMVTAQKN